MCDETNKCFVHFRNDGESVDFRGLRAKATYLGEFAVYSEEETRELTEAELDEALIIRTQIIMGVDVHGATERGKALRKRTSPPMSIVVRVGHGALSDASFDGDDRVDTLMPVGDQGIDELHDLAVWAVNQGTYNDQD